MLLYSDASSEKNYCQPILISIVCLLSPLLKQQTCILPQVGVFKLVIDRVVCNRLSDNLTEFWSSHNCSICLQPLSKEQVIFQGVKSHFLHCFWKSCLSNHLTFECSALDNIQVRRYYQPVYLKGLGSCVLLHTCVCFRSVMGSTVVNVTDSLCSCWSHLYSDECILDMTNLFQWWSLNFIVSG